MFTHKRKQSLINTILGWMRDIDSRVGSAISWPLTSEHRQFIEMLQADEGGMTFDEWKGHATTLMRFHAMARNDIYDYQTVEVHIDSEGHEGNEFEIVSREEGHVRVFLHIYRNSYGDEEE